MKHTKLRNFFIIAFLVCFLIPTFSVNSFAIGNLDFYANDMFYYSEYYDSQNGVYVQQNVTKSIETISNVQCVKYSIPTASGNYTRFTNVYNIQNLKANHEYALQFGYAYNPLRNYCHLLLTLQVLNGNGTIISQQILYTGDTGLTGLQNVSLNFIPDLTNVSEGYTMRLNFEFIQTSNTQAYNCWLSNYIYLNDNDDNSGFFETIISWLQGISNSISNLGTNISSWLSNLGTSIVNSISSLGSNLNTWLTGVKDGIVNKLQNVQTAITDAISGIQQWFINLGQQIGDFFTMLKNYILYFQHPVTLNADGVPVDSNGNPVYTNPFSTLLSSITDTLDEWFNDLDNFILSIQSTNQQITSYLTTFTNIFNRFNAGVPLISVILTLALIIIVIRKILGR